jgi:hypothetical protein
VTLGFKGINWALVTGNLALLRPERIASANMIVSQYPEFTLILFSWWMCDQFVWDLKGFLPLILILCMCYSLLFASVFTLLSFYAALDHTTFRTATGPNLFAHSNYPVPLFVYCMYFSILDSFLYPEDAGSSFCRNMSTCTTECVVPRPVRPLSVLLPQKFQDLREYCSASALITVVSTWKSSGTQRNEIAFTTFRHS